MKPEFKDYPICVNCKFYLEEKTGPMQIAGTCGLTTVDPVTGDYQQRRTKVKLAAEFRKTGMPCGAGGKFFQAGKKKVTPKKKPVEKVIEEPKPEVKTVEVEVPEVSNNLTLEDLGNSDPEPKKRRRRDK